MPDFDLGLRADEDLSTAGRSVGRDTGAAVFVHPSVGFTHTANARLSRFETDALLLRIQNQESAALAELFDKYARLVFSIGLRVLRRAEEAEDLVQDVFLFLWSRPGLFVPGRRPGHEWLIRVIYHRAFDRRRYLIARLAYNGKFDLCAQQGDKEIAADRTKLLISNEGNFGELLYWHSQLDAAFRDLTNEQQKTLTLFFYEGYTLSEISEELGISLMSIRNYYYRGLKKLAGLLRQKS